MKKIIIAIIVVVVIVLLLFLWWGYNKISLLKLDSINVARLVFNYGEIKISNDLTDSEIAIVRDIFDGSRTYIDELSCGFSEDIAVVIDNSKTFCVACDTCPIVYWKEKKRYIKITEGEKIQLYNIFEKYGGKFPCV